MSNNYKPYEAPQLTVVTFKAEHGFAESLPIPQELSNLDVYFYDESLEDNTTFGRTGYGLATDENGIQNGSQQTWF